MSCELLRGRFALLSVSEVLPCATCHRHPGKHISTLSVRADSPPKSYANSGVTGCEAEIMHMAYKENGPSNAKRTGYENQKISVSRITEIFEIFLAPSLG